MQGQGKRNKHLKNKARTKAQMLALLLGGVSQKECARILGINEGTVGRWLRETPFIMRKVRAARAGEIKNPFKLDDSLSAFIAYTRLHQPDILPVVQDAYNAFLKTI